MKKWLLISSLLLMIACQSETKKNLIAVHPEWNDQEVKSGLTLKKKYPESTEKEIELFVKYPNLTYDQIQFFAHYENITEEEINSFNLVIETYPNFDKKILMHMIKKNSELGKLKISILNNNDEPIVSNIKISNALGVN